MSVSSINAWDYAVVKEFHAEHYTGVVEEFHLRELKSFKRKIGLDDNNKPMYDYVEGWLVILNKEKYVLPQQINGQDLRTLLPIKIKNTEPFTHCTNIYQRPTINGMILFKIPAERTMTFKQWFTMFAQFKHTNAIHWDIYKAIVLGSLFLRFNYRVATQPGFGKDSLPTILSNLLPLEVGIYTPKSAPRLMAMLERRLLMVNEIVDVKKDDMESLEPVIRIAGDMRTSVPNSALPVSGFTKSEYNISHLSMGFIYNELKDYMPPNLKTDKSAKYFDNAFTPATNQRFLPLLLKGELDVSQFKRLNVKRVYKEKLPDIKNWIKMTKWIMKDGFNEILTLKKNYKWHMDKKIGTKTGRLYSHFNTLLDVFRALSSTEQEFNQYADEIYKCYKDYLSMLKFDHEDCKIEYSKIGKLKY